MNKIIKSLKYNNIILNLVSVLNCCLKSYQVLKPNEVSHKINYFKLLIILYNKCWIKSFHNYLVCIAFSFQKQRNAHKYSQLLFKIHRMSENFEIFKNYIYFEISF